MAANHETLVEKARLWATEQGYRLFKNVVGSGWSGKLLNSWQDSREGHVVEIGHAEMRPFGLLARSGDKWTTASRGAGRPGVPTKKKTHGGTWDLVGYAPVVITPDMVGRKVALFLAVEIKTEEYSTLDEDQVNWGAHAKAEGAVMLVGRPGPDGELALEEFQP